MAKKQPTTPAPALAPDQQGLKTRVNQNRPNPNAKPKGQSKPAPPPSAAAIPVPNRDLFHRVNFSYQASVYLHSLGESSLSGSGVGPRFKSSKQGKERARDYDFQRELPRDEGVDFGLLARRGMEECRKMGVHNQLKLDPSLKRSGCKTCSTVLVPGLTSRWRNRPSRRSFNVINQTCLQCETVRSLPSPPVELPLNPDSTMEEKNAGGSTPMPMTPTSHLDGPVRSARRRKAVRKVPFYALEGSQAGDARGKAGEGPRGHEVWRGDEKVEGWGTSAGDGPAVEIPSEDIVRSSGQVGTGES